LVWAILLLLAVGVAAVIAVRAQVSGGLFWLPLTGVWLALAAVNHLAFAGSDPTKSVLIGLTLGLPIAMTGLIARAERRRGHTVWRAGSIAFLLGALVGAATPLLQLYLICAVTRDCL